MMNKFKLLEEHFDLADQNLHELTHSMIQMENLSEFFRAFPNRKEELYELCEQTLQRAFVAHQTEARYSVHQTLLSLYDMHLYPPDKKSVFNQFEPTLSALRHRLESGWLRYEQERIPPLQPPQDPHDFICWLEERISTHPLSSHPLFRYLEEDASLRDMADYFHQESTIDTRLDDLLALGQIGMSDRVKIEIGENFWSELGCGDPTLIHTNLFNDLLEALGVQGQNAPETILPEALICGNLLLLTSLHRQYVYMQHGVLATMEMMAPERFERIARGGRRLGLSDQVLHYLDLHSTLDIEHGDGWRDNVLIPTVEANVAARDDIVKGVFYRLNTSQDYCDALYTRYRHGISYK